MTHVVLRTVLMLTVGVFAFACSEQPVGLSPTSPSAGSSSPSATAQPPTIPVTGPTLSGTVYEVTPQGLRAVSTGYGNVWSGVDGGSRTAFASIDTSGRYTISGLPPGSRIRLLANAVNLQQTCAVSTVFDGSDTVQDIRLVRSGTYDVTCQGPTLSGVVFRVVEGTRRPMKGQRVGFYSGNRAPFDVFAITNAEGRFEFGGLPPGAGSLLAGDCSDAMDSKPIEIRDSTNVVDFDLTAFVQSCPWMFLPQ